jgi:hypothetical protein
MLNSILITLFKKKLHVWHPNYICTGLL